MNAGDPLEPLPSEIEELRGRATRCRAYAKEYASDVGASLSELAVELDRKADRLEAESGAPDSSVQPKSSADPARPAGK